jgi:hypothetical protein
MWICPGFAVNLNNLVNPTPSPTSLSSARHPLAILLRLISSLCKKMSLSNKLAITDIADQIKGKRILIR